MEQEDRQHLSTCACPARGPVAIALTPFGPGVERLEARCGSCGENRVLTSFRKEAGIG